MNDNQEYFKFVSRLDVFEIERQARELQARAVADFARSLLRGIVSRLNIGAAIRSA